jgi:tetratricopeptide (TPR) repeat protein
MSKSMLVTLPLVLLLLDYWPLKRFAAAPGESNLRVVRRLLLEKLPLLLISILFAVVQMNADRVGIVSFRDLPFTQRAGNAVVSYVVYLGQTVRPVNLGVFYPHPRGTLPVRDVLFAMLILVLLSAAAISARKRQPWLIVGWLWYLIMLAPVIGIVQSGYLARADRYTYLPQIGLCIAGVWTVADYAGRRGRHRLWATGSIAALALCVLMVAAFCQTTFWLNSVTLWSHTLKCAVDNTLTRNALGLALLQQGRTEEAIAQYRQALRINPGFPKTYCDLANALLQQGQIGEAIEAMEKAIALQPANQEIKNQLAWTLATAPEASLRNGPRAVELALQASQAARGNDPNILRTLAAAYAQAGMYPDAVRTAQSALQLAKNGELAGMLSRDIKLYQTARALPNGP